MIVADRHLEATTKDMICTTGKEMYDVETDTLWIYCGKTVSGKKHVFRECVFTKESSGQVQSAEPYHA
jgi:hypothetical protein